MGTRLTTGSGGDRAPLRRLLLRIMPPSWHPVPACVRHGHSAGGQSLLLQRWCCRRAVLSCSSEGAASIRKSGPEIENRCTLEGVNREKLASILKSGPEIKNRCALESVNRQKHASIRKSGPEIKNRCALESVNRQKHASIRKSGLEIKNRCTLALRLRSAGETILCCRKEN